MKKMEGKSLLKKLIVFVIPIGKYYCRLLFDKNKYICVQKKKNTKTNNNNDDDER